MRKLLILCVLLVATVSMQAKTLVVYYSNTGTCASIKDELIAQIDADVLQVEPAVVQDYVANNYAIGSAMISAIGNNPDDAASYPEIKPVSVNIAQYNNIILITPLWWSQMAAIMQSFLFEHGQEMAGKNIGVIVASHSSGISGVVNDAKRLIPSGVFMSESLWFKNGELANASSKISTWLSNVGYAEKAAFDINVSVGGQQFPAKVEYSQTGKDFISKLPLTLNMSELNGNEKYCYGVPLTRNDQYYSTINAGDLMLYNGNCVVLFYGAAGGYNYTRIGQLLSTDGLASALGNGAVTVTFSTADINLIDGSEYAQTEAIEYDNIYYERNFNNTNWQALYVPFGMDYSDWDEKCEIAELKEIRNVDGEDVLVVQTLAEGDNTSANTPYLIKAKSTGTVYFHITDAITSAASAESFVLNGTNADYTFSGTYVPVTDMQSAGHYALAGGELRPAASDASTLKAMRWYMDATSHGAPAKARLRVVEMDDATGVDEIIAKPTHIEGIYTLDGRLIMQKAASLRPGIYIINGNKQIIK